MQTTKVFYNEECIEMDDDAKIVKKNNIPVILTKMEYNLLKIFLENKDRVLTRSKIIELLGSTKMKERYVDVLVSRLRKKIGRCIQTRLGFGYGIIDNV